MSHVPGESVVIRLARRARALPVQRVLGVALATALVLSLMTQAASPQPPVAVVLPGHRPNIVLVLSDDQRADEMTHMPNVRRLLTRHGVRFTHAMVPNSLCCPSRSSILSGLYSHDSGVWTNGAKWYGGWSAFHANGLESRSVAVALQTAGYRTGLIGKYLNGYGSYAPKGYVPPGWNTFEAFDTRRSGKYFNYWLTDGSHYGGEASDYSTDVLAKRAARFVRTTPAHTPLFLYFAPYGPHAPWLPAPRDETSLNAKMKPYRVPSLTASRRGKPAYVRHAPKVSAFHAETVLLRQEETLISVDDAVGRLVRTLRRTGRLHNTLFVYTSDNGVEVGEHGLLGKDVPYHEDTDVPMVMRWDGHIPPGSVDPRIALNVDLAATFTTAASVRMQSDGLDLLGSARRRGAVIEAEQTPGHRRPSYCGWRTRRWMYVRYSSGEQELYDYATDPYELHNLAHLPAYRPRVARFVALDKAHCYPTPPSFHW
ncbi:MAG: hypothetical protein QOE01_1331 [Actinomycetota bacterium]|nr:hypothetical protein [Actinomycetota bacterium]